MIQSLPTGGRAPAFAAAQLGPLLGRAHWRSRELLMFPTFVRLSKASRLPLTPKRGNKDYYKGKLTPGMLNLSLKGQFDDTRYTTGVSSWRTSHWGTRKARSPRKGEIQAFG